MRKVSDFLYFFFGWALQRGGQGPGKGPNVLSDSLLMIKLGGLIYIVYKVLGDLIYIVYKVSSIYRVLPGFREFAVFEKSKRFFIILFGWALQRGGQGPGKGPNVLSDSLFMTKLGGLTLRKR